MRITPPLHSLRLSYIPYTPMVVHPVHADWLNSQSLMQYSEQRHMHHDWGTQYEYAQSIPENCHVWLLDLEGQDIGTITAYIDELNLRANMGILLGRHHGQGFGREAWQRIMDWLWHEGMERIEAGCMGTNTPMRKLAEACGMRLEATVPSYFRVGDKRLPMVIYGLLRD